MRPNTPDILTLNKKDRTIKRGESNADDYEIEESLLGDSTVLSYSASISDKYANKTFFTELSHTGMIKISLKENIEKEIECYTFIKSIVENGKETGLSPESSKGI